MSDRPGPAWLRRRAIAAAVVAVVALGGIYWTAVREQPSAPAAVPAAPIRSIAVLPLDNLSGDPAQEYFADGMTDELISTLGRIGGVNVISRTSVMQFKGSTTALPQIAQTLGADAILEGSVFVEAAGGRPSTVRVNARLLHAGTDTLIWEKTFQTVVSDVLALQSQVARAVADGIRHRLTAVQERSLAAGGAQDFGAFDLYLRGRYYWNMRTKEGLTRSVQYFQAAIDRDPAYAVAYAGLADAYNVLGAYGMLPRADADTQAHRAATRALELDQSLAEAHVSLALIHSQRFEWEQAEERFTRALALNPSYATARQWYGIYLSQHGRLSDAMAQAEQAVALDPLSISVQGAMGVVHLLARRYDDAIAQLESSVRMDPDVGRVRMALAEAYAHKGEFGRALAEADRAVALDGRNVHSLADLGYIRAAAGRHAEAHEIVSELTERYRGNEDGAAGGLAVVYAGLRDADRTFEWLDRARERREPALADLKVDPRFDSVRNDSRFATLLASIGLGQ
jgi:TolB-like protein/Tfp pilus assembly protein PilF